MWPVKVARAGPQLRVQDGSGFVLPYEVMEYGRRGKEDISCLSWFYQLKSNFW